MPVTYIRENEIPSEPSFKHLLNNVSITKKPFLIPGEKCMEASLPSDQPNHLINKIKVEKENLSATKSGQTLKGILKHSRSKKLDKQIILKSELDDKS